MPDIVELGPKTIKALSAAIGQAVDDAIGHHYMPPEDEITVRDIAPLVVDEIKRAIHEVLDEREDEDRPPELVS